MDETINNSIIEKLIEKIVTEPLDKLTEIMKLSIRILICIIVIIIIPFITIIMVLCYFAFLIMKKNFDKYDQLINFLKKVGDNETSNYMNYGYWDKPNMTLFDANKRLCKIIGKKGDLKNAKKILDVGCGYGEQDFYWKKKITAKIDAIDISKVSIKKAKKINTNEDITFDTGNACALNFDDNTYDRVISLESAFHYNPRTDFLKEYYRVLNEGGKLVIADILYNDDDDIDMFNVINRNSFEKLFDIPKSNKIGIDEFKKQLEDVGFKVKIEDITDKTFKPYYNYFFTHSRCPDNFMLPSWMYNLLRIGCGFYINTICGGTNGFKYVIAVCEK
tara:strand:+ start:17 stop:1015 length:999 start_codon:yes stop_codon:yes gene_type:complete